MKTRGIMCATGSVSRSAVGLVGVWAAASLACASNDLGSESTVEVVDTELDDEPWTKPAALASIPHSRLDRTAAGDALLFDLNPCEFAAWLYERPHFFTVEAMWSGRLTVPGVGVTTWAVLLPWSPDLASAAGPGADSEIDRDDESSSEVWIAFPGGLDHERELLTTTQYALAEGDRIILFADSHAPAPPYDAHRPFSPSHIARFMSDGTLRSRQGDIAAADIDAWLEVQADHSASGPRPRHEDWALVGRLACDIAWASTAH